MPHIVVIALIFYTFVAGVVGIYVSYRYVCFLLQMRRENIAHRAYAQKYGVTLDELPFFYGLCLGTGVRYADTEAFYADAPLTTIVQYKGRLAGVIGIRIHDDVLEVLQMQGFKGGVFRGVDAGTVLLGYAERIAIALEKTRVRVIPAECQDSYELQLTNARDALYHERRMHRRYNQTPLRNGYMPSEDGMWWEKVLREP